MDTDKDAKHAISTSAHHNDSKDRKIDEKKIKRLSSRPHNKEHYKEKLDEQVIITKELKELLVEKDKELSALQTKFEQLLKKQLELKEKYNTLSKQQKPMEVPVTPIATNAANTTSYYDQLSNGLTTIYSYMPSFSGLRNRLPSMPSLFRPDPSHHEKKTTGLKL